MGATSETCIAGDGPCNYTCRIPSDDIRENEGVAAYLSTGRYWDERDARGEWRDDNSAMWNAVAAYRRANPHLSQYGWPGGPSVTTTGDGAMLHGPPGSEAGYSNNCAVCAHVGCEGASRGSLSREWIAANNLCAGCIGENRDECVAAGGICAVQHGDGNGGDSEGVAAS